MKCWSSHLISLISCKDHISQHNNTTKITPRQRENFRKGLFAEKGNPRNCFCIRNIRKKNFVVFLTGPPTEAVEGKPRCVLEIQKFGVLSVFQKISFEGQPKVASVPKWTTNLFLAAKKK